MGTIKIAVTGGLDIVADEWGPRDGQPVLMQHGGGQNRHAWKATAERLGRAGYRVLTVDARGHGDSDWSAAAQYDMEHFAQDVLDLCAYLGRPPVLVGASMGGMSGLFAQGMSGARQIYAGVILVDITPRMDPAGAGRIVAFMAANPEGFSTLDEAGEAIATYNPHRPRPKSTDGLRKVLRESDDGRWFWRWDPAWLTSKADLHQEPDALAERMDFFAGEMHRAAALLTTPVLLVRGAQSDLVSVEAVEEFRAVVPHAEFVDVTGAGHMVAGDENDVFTAAVAEFLQRTIPAGSQPPAAMP